MTNTHEQRTPSWRQHAGLVVLFCMGLMAGTYWRDLPADGQETRDQGTRKAFLSGSERSVIVLEEMLTVMKKMDERLERIERTIAPKPNPGGPAR